MNSRKLSLREGRLTLGVAAMVGLGPSGTHLLSSSAWALVSPFISVAGNGDTDVRIQKHGILLHERGFRFQDSPVHV